MSAGFAIFVKTPGRSALKTRLAAGIGEAAALTWYRLAARAVGEVVAAACGNDGGAYWAVAEAEALDDPRWTGLPVLWQGAGGLGERMARVHDELVGRHGGGILLGADAPQIDADDLQNAVAWLECDAAHSVLGPAADGGFWLFGSNRRQAHAAWNQVAYSQPDTAERFVAALSAAGQWQRLRRLDDVDRAADLAPCIAALAALAEPTPAQRRLLEYSLRLVEAASGPAADAPVAGR